MFVKFAVTSCIIFLMLHFMEAKKNQEFYCAACRVVVEEIEHSISKVDPKKTIEIEGFRVDPQGNQKSTSIPYSRSETHLTEITENLCSEMNKYAQSKDKETNRLKFIRTDSRDGKGVTLENVSMSGEISNQLRYACENILEEHEEDIIKYFKKNRVDPFSGFCKKVTGLCSKGNDGKNEL
eukprot:Seg97.7 transcript_id=Seg97.7/GoldUCD/mRNA.D3Y31 product="Protein canopy 2" protein_id=Seg97.7/GoldUCD/D3Y31